MTALIVAHDGAPWLPHVIKSLLGQSRPVQRVVAVDTGSRDRSGSVLAGHLGHSVVFGMDRGTGYGAAVARALQHRAANVNVPFPAGLPAGERTEWVWLLHDDCEPAPDALEQLLRGAAEARAAAVLGPKVRDWSDRQVILEAGVTIDTAGRRITGIEPREVDQGQHDGDRDSLAVGSAGMLVRRDVWDAVGGFDPGLPLFREDVDFCWRVHSAGYRVRVITDAVVYHVEAAARRRRPISVARRPQQLDRRNALLTLAANLPPGPMLGSAVASLTVSALRSLFFLVAKRPAAALDELAAVGSVLGQPLRLLSARHRRARGRRSAYGRLRADIPPGRSLRRIAEFAASALSGSAQLDTAGSHHATDDPDADDFLLTDTGLVQRILTNPGVLLFLGLAVVSLVAERTLLGSGTLGGGALVPAWGGASGLWREYLQAFHPTGIGSGSIAPPYLAVVAALATVLGGKPWLAVDVILLGCVPLGGLTAFLAARRVTRSALVRVWAAASYALAPVAMGTIAAGRLGTAAAFVLMPLIAVLAGRMLTEPRRRARRAAWAAGLAVAVAAAFLPLVWVLVLAAALVFAAIRPSMWRNLAIVVTVPPVLLLPWTIQAAAHPSAALLEPGVQQPGLASSHLPARSLMLLSPGGPGLPPVWVTGGLIVAALAALLLGRRRALVIAGWGVALFGLLAAAAVSRAIVTPPGGGPSVPAWPGIAMIVAAGGLLLAAAGAGESLARRAGGRTVPGLRPARRAGAVALAAAACSTPLLAAGSWLASGTSGPVAPSAGPVIPPVVAAASTDGLQVRTLVLRSSGGRVSYSLQRGTSPTLADPDLMPSPAAQRALDGAVATLVAPNGGEAADQGQVLAQFGIGFVLLPAPVDQGLARLLGAVTGLRPVSATSAFELWRVAETPARIRVVEPNGAVVAVRSGPVGASAAAPSAGGILELAEPKGGWGATLNGRRLSPVTSPAGSWAQAFRLPVGGGTLHISRSGQTGRDLMVALEALLLAAVAVLALPGSRAAAEDGALAADEATDAARRAAGRGGASGDRDRAAAADGREAGQRRVPGAGRAGRKRRKARDAAPGPGRYRRAAAQRLGAGAKGLAAARPRRGGPPAAAGSAGAAPAGPSDARPGYAPAGAPGRRPGWSSGDAPGWPSGPEWPSGDAPEPRARWQPRPGADPGPAARPPGQAAPEHRARRLPARRSAAGSWTDAPLSPLDPLPPRGGHRPWPEEPGRPEEPRWPEEPGWPEYRGGQGGTGYPGSGADETQVSRWPAPEPDSGEDSW